MKKHNILIVYSSRATQNSKKIAEALAWIFSSEAVIASVENAPAPDKFNYVILGFGVYHGWPDDAMRAYMKNCRKQDVGLFMTLGAWPDSSHASVCMGRAEGLLESCRISGRYICHGKLADDLVERLSKLPEGSPHAMTDERRKRIEAAAAHPNAKDCAEAVEIFRKAYEKSKRPPHK